MLREFALLKALNLFRRKIRYPDKNHAGINLTHCAYCSTASDKNYLPEGTIQLGLTLIPNAAKFFLEYESPVLQSYFRSSHPSQAPPLV
jgi:hypothetical protein